MFYIAKLARRLARLRLGEAGVHFGTLTTLLVLTACAAGEPTSVDSNNTLTETKTLFISPRLITLEGSQGIRFAAYESLIPGSAEVTAIEWTASGGSVGADGAYSSSGVGEFKVIGKRKGWANKPPEDTATVIVVPPQPEVIGLEVTPTNESAPAGTMVQFTALGWMSDSTQVPVGVTWTATGGVIDAGGMYKAGGSPGTYQVTATHVSTGLSATVPVEVTAAIVQSIRISPQSVSLIAGNRQQFSVTANMSDGSTSTPAGVTYSATGGTITNTGLYTAPSSGGTYTVTARLLNISGSTLSSSASVSVTSSSTTLVGGLPHMPGAYVRFAEYSSDGLPNTGNGILAGKWSSTASSMLTIVSDPTGKRSPNPSFQFRFYTGESVGSSVGILSGWALDESGEAPEYREFYESGWFKIPTPDFETPGPGMKLLGYWGVGQKGSKVPNQIYTMINGNGSNTSIMSSWTLDIRQQNNVARSMAANRNTKRVRAGIWQRYEVQMILNTVDQPNGVLRFWLDNGDGTGLTLTHEYTDVKFRTSASNSNDGIDSRSGFYGRRWDPIWGGMGGNAKTRNDYLWVDHVYIAGERL
jgi:hypothetical protein